jgi:DNA-binding SARP family transcriptional activator
MSNAAQTAQPVAASLVLLGEPRLEVAGAAVVPLERKDAALLAVLAVDRSTPRAKMASLLWPDVDDEAARNNLRQRLHRLRKRTARDVVASVNDVLRLNDDVTHDLASLPARLAEDPAAASGELLGSFDYGDCVDLNEWLAIAREQWRGARRNALAEIASRLETQGQIAAALQYAERLVTDDPLLEHAHRRLMRLHYLRGDRAAALAAFARCKEVLARHLKADPAHETLELARLVEASGALPGAAAPPRPVAVLRPPRLVGRDAEWRRLEQAWQAAQIAVVLGEAGIGKTRLLTDFAGAQRDTLVVGARPGDRRVPYALLARLLRAGLQRYRRPLEPWVRDELARLLPELGALAPDRLEPLRLLRACAAVLDAMQASGLAALVVDDLHFADEASVEALLSLLATERETPLRWLLGSRAGELPAQLADGWRAEEAVARLELHLGPLDTPAIEALLDSLALPGFPPLVWAEPLARHTGGNPLFILETLNALMGGSAERLPGKVTSLPAPSNVGSLIERRLAQLSGPALRLARVAALAGQDFAVELAAQVLQSHPLDLAEAWRELESAQVIRDNAFAHDLIFEATLQSIPAPIARLLHRDIAAYLARHEAPAARVAVHWVEAEAWADAGAAFVAAARGALHASRRVEEVEYWDAAFQNFQRAGLRAEAFQARSESIESLLFVFDTQRGRAAVRELEELAETDGEELDVLIARSYVHVMAVEFDAVVDTTRSAVEKARALGAGWREYDAAVLLALGLAQTGHSEEGVRVLEGYGARVTADGDAPRRYKYWSNLAYVLQLANRRRQCVHALQQAIALAEAMDNLGEVQTNTSNLATALSDLGRLREALAFAERAYRLRDRIGDMSSVPAAALESQLAQNLVAAGRFDQALVHFAAAAEYFRTVHHAAWLAVVENHLAVTWLQLGQPGRALQSLSALGKGVLPGTRSRRVLVEVRIDAALGRPRRVAALVQALADLGHGDPGMTLLLRLEATADLPAAEAAQACVELAAVAERIEYSGTTLKAQLLRAAYLQQAGDHDGAQAVVRTVGALDDVVPRDFYFPEALWIVFRVLDAAGDRVAAAAALQRAVKWIRQTALPNVPPELRDGFLDRNPTNRAVLTTASRFLVHADRPA